MGGDSIKVESFSWRLFWVVGLTIIVTQSLIHGAELWFISDWQTRGQFGDSFGVVTSLFSGLGFAGLICTIVLQKKQIDIQRDDSEVLREETRESLNNQRRANHLSALTFLMEHYDRRLLKLNAVRRDGPAGAIIKKESELLLRRWTELNEKISTLHGEIINGLGADNVR